MRSRIIKLTVLTFFFLLGLAIVSFADEPVKKYEWNDKLGRAAANIVTCPLEIPRGINTTSKEQGPALGWTLGLAKGLSGTVMRVGAGVIDLITFPFGFPNKDKSPLIKPEYVWQNW